jgi:hypothetical protein
LKANRRSGREKGNLFSIILEEESSEGASPGVLGVERDFQGSDAADTVERVAKPWGRDFREAGQGFPDALKEVRRRAVGSGDAEGRGSSSKGLFDWIYESTLIQGRRR